jgi:Phage derived protein Gp49-like (DUF891)
MRLELLINGHASKIYQLVISAEGQPFECPSAKFLGDLEATAPASYNQLSGVMDQHASQGTVRNKEKSRFIGGGIFEFKSRYGARLLYFFGPGKKTILLNGFQKGAKLKREIARAQGLRAQWQEEQHL